MWVLSEIEWNQATILLEKINTTLLKHIFWCLFFRLWFIKATIIFSTMMLVCCYCCCCCIYRSIHNFYYKHSTNINSLQLKRSTCFSFEILKISKASPNREIHWFFTFPIRFLFWNFLQLLWIFLMNRLCACVCTKKY